MPSADASRNNSNVLASLEIGRGIAALLVCAYHLAYLAYEYYGAYPLANMFRAGHCGVEYFFVLSGFIIYYSHSTDLGRREMLGNFALKRAIRIYPLYLLIFFPLAAAYIAAPSLSEQGEFTPISMLADALLLPHNSRMVLGVAWTLKHELVFYAIFALAIGFKRVRLYAVLAWMTAIVVWNIAYWNIDTGPRGPILFSTYNLGFGLGVAAAHLARTHPLPRPVLVLLTGCAAFIGLMTYEWTIGRHMPHDDIPLGSKLSPILYSLAASLVILGGASLDLRGAFRATRFTAIFGGSSYALYLLHAPAASFLVRLMKATKLPLGPELAFILLMAAVIAASIFTHMFIEKPMLKWLRARLLPRKPTASAISSSDIAKRSRGAEA